MIRTIKCDYCHGKNAVRLSFPGDCVWHTEVTIDPSTGLSDQHEVYVCKDCGKVMLKKVGETLEYVEKIYDADGAPIEVGDIVYCDDDPEPFRVASFDDSEHIRLTLAKDPNSILLYKMESSRLSHKCPILDADGVPINVGDVVYSVPAVYSVLEKGKAYTVERIETNDGKYFIDIAEAKDRWPMYSVNPENLTHDQPTPDVLDADGIPIKIGDTVWTIYDGCKYVVSAVSPHRPKKYGGVRTIEPIVEYENGRWDFAKKVTHERPDSWERLEEDAAKCVCEYAEAKKSIADADSYTCIECPYDEPGPHTDAGCHERMRLDLVRRAKALAKAGEVE